MSASQVSPDRFTSQSSKLIGFYVTLLRRSLEHFFPDAVLEHVADRTRIDLEQRIPRPNHQLRDDPDGLGVLIDWFHNIYSFLPASPTPFLPAERLLIEAAVRLLDRRYLSLFDPDAMLRDEMFAYQVEDLIIAEQLATPDSIRIPAALEALRAAALSTYENRHLSSGVLLLGTPHDPAEPDRANPPGAPRYNIRLSAIKSFHRLCDGVRTVFLVDRHGDLVRVVDVAHWADAVQAGSRCSGRLCPRAYASHARATLDGDHVLLLLTPAQEIKVFARGEMAYAYSDARWRLLDIPTKYQSWVQALGKTEPPDLAHRLFQAALNLSEDRHGALLVVLRDPDSSLDLLVTRGDQILGEQAMDDPGDPDNLSPRVAKRTLHHVARGRRVQDLEMSVMEALAGVDGALVADTRGRLLSFGAILRLGSESIRSPRAVEGARTTAAIAASYHGPVLKVSEDGFLTMFLSGRRVWEL
jgi:hypothetical protein